jgi:glycosyltransferase involved in cell wall biosynthesis
MAMPHRFLTALPVYNEVAHVAAVVAEVRRFSPEVLVVNDGSRDGTSEVLAGIQGIQCLTHPVNRGYGAALRSAFEFAIDHGYDILVTIDCDGQHQPCRIPRFVAACEDCDIVSGSRYLERFAGDSEPPVERRRINERLTAEINTRLGLQLTDASCGFKAYRVEALKTLPITDDGYAMPLELWVRAAQAGLRIRELAVPLIYLEEERSFGGSLDNGDVRLKYYRQVLDRALATADMAGGEACRGACAR